MTTVRSVLVGLTISIAVLITLTAILVAVDLRLHRKFDRTAGLNYRGYRGPVLGRKGDHEIAAVASTDVLSEIAGKYVGKDDPVCCVRAQAGLPSVGEILEPFAFPHIVEGWMRGSHHGPLMPCAMHQANPTRLDGPPRVVALGFQLNNGGLVGPIDLFDDVAFDLARRQANEIADMLRRHGPFEPHRLPLEEMEYTTMPQIMGKLADRFKAV